MSILCQDCEKEKEEMRRNIKDLREATSRLLKFNEELCEDVGVSKHYPSADFARKVLERKS